MTVQLAITPDHRWTFSTADLVSAAGAAGFAGLTQVPLDDIAYVQFADALAPESHSLGRETMHRRALPGEGVLELELDRFATTLLARGWEGTVASRTCGYTSTSRSKV